MFGKHFASMYTGSLFGKPTTVFAVWGYCISNMRPRKDGVCYVELNPMLLAPMFASKQEDIRSAIDFLLSDDPLSRTEDHDGRRLELEHGNPDGPATYLVVNGAAYRNARDEETRRDQIKEAVRRHRNRKRKSDGNPRNQSKPRKAHAEIRDQRQRSEAEERETRAPEDETFASPPLEARPVAAVDLSERLADAIGGAGGLGLNDVTFKRLRAIAPDMVRVASERGEDVAEMIASAWKRFKTDPDVIAKRIAHQSTFLGQWEQWTVKAPRRSRGPAAPSAKEDFDEMLREEAANG